MTSRKKLKDNVIKKKQNKKPGNTYKENMVKKSKLQAIMNSFGPHSTILNKFKNQWLQFLCFMNSQTAKTREQ